MKFLTDKLNKLISSLRENSLFNDIIFVSAYNNDNIERPVVAPVCSVGIQSAEIRTELYACATFELRMYSSLSEGGSGCIGYLERISRYLLESLSGVFEADIGEVSYDSNMLAFCSELLLKCNINEFLEDESLPENPVEVTINSKSFNAGRCNVTERTEFHEVNSLWEGEPIGAVEHRQVYEIELGEFEADAARYASGFSGFTLEFENARYSGCKFKQIVYDMNRNYVSTALISATGRQVSYG